MNRKTAASLRATWRDRFLEIAREAEAAHPVAAARPVAGLRLRARLSKDRVRLLAGTGQQLA